LTAQEIGSENISRERKKILNNTEDSGLKQYVTAFYFGVFLIVGSLAYLIRSIDDIVEAPFYVFAVHLVIWGFITSLGQVLCKRAKQAIPKAAATPESAEFYLKKIMRAQRIQMAAIFTLIVVMVFIEKGFSVGGFSK
jgi:hypothetical protein